MIQQLTRVAITHTHTHTHTHTTKNNLNNSNLSTIISQTRHYIILGQEETDILKITQSTYQPPSL